VNYLYISINSIKFAKNLNMNVLDDELDFQILKMLQEDGRASFTDMAKELKVAVSTIRNRYVNYIEKGIIKINARITPDKIGLNVYSTIFIAVRPKSMSNSAVNELMKIEEISFLASTTGEYDFELNIICRDHQHLADLMQHKINVIEGIHYSKTNFYLQIYKFTQPNLNLVKNK